MNRMWEPIIFPIFKFINPNFIVEIGAEKGINTRNILKYCLDHDSKLISIDPNPLFDLNKFKSDFGEKFTLLNELSLNCLPYLGEYDCILIDGDHNYYTVFQELQIIGEKFDQESFPIIFLHDVGWPYGRRDLYYNPENIPKEFLNDYSRLGMYPGKKKLSDDGGLNSHLLNANDENTPKNGVLTAIEDFIEGSSLNLDFHLFSPFHGLGILHAKDENLSMFIEDLFKSDKTLDFVEIYYINMIINYENDKLVTHEQINLLNENILNFKNEIDKLKNINSDNLNEIDKLKNINSDNLNEISGLKNELMEVSNQFNFKDSQFEELNSRFVSLNNDFHSIEELNEKLKAVNDVLQKRNVSLSRTKKEQYFELLKLKEYSDSLEERNNILSITKRELFDNIVKLNSNINNLKNMVNYYDNKIISLSEKLENQSTNFDELNEMYVEIVTKKYLLEEENNYLRDSYQDTKNTLDSILNSRSWKYSSIFRKLKSILKNK